MEKKMLRNGLVSGAILLFIGMSVVPGMSGYNNPVSRNTIHVNDYCGCSVYDENDDTHKENLFSTYPLMSDSIHVDSLNIDVDLSKFTIIDTPAEFSWIDYEGKDWTTPVKHQGNCGSCWLFAAVGTLESVINIREECADLNQDLSEQYVLSCMPEAGSCYGGNVEHTAFYYIMNTTDVGNHHNGIIPETCLTYQASYDNDIPCSEKCHHWEEMLIPISDFGENWLVNGYDTPEAREIIKSQIMLKGPVLTYMYVTDRFQIWGSICHKPTDYYPITRETQDDEIILNHAIVIAGWKDDSSIGNGGYWVCKNSWGTDWGHDGFFNIEYGSLFTGIFLGWVDYDPDSFDWPPVADAGGFYQGNVGKEVPFDGSKSFDAEGEIVSYYWDFGDGTHVTGVSPSHIYSQPGIYPVTLTVTDSGNNIASDTTVAGVGELPIEIDILGGLGITVVVRNMIEEELTNLEWSVYLSGFLVVGISKEGTIASLSPENEFTLKIPLIGVGPGTVSVTIADVSKAANFFIIGPFVIMR